MERLKWEVRNFSLGMHTEPAKVGEGSERFAVSAAGLRADANGHLRPRVAFKRFGEVGESAITGVASGERFIVYLRADSSVWIRFADEPEVEREINFVTRTGVSGITGVLSIVAEYADFLIIKGQGGTPWWVDMREDSDYFLQAHRFGIVPPVNNPGVTPLRDTASAPPVLINGFMYFYRWTFVRVFGDDPYKIRDGEYLHEGVLFSGMESNPSPVLGFYRNVIPDDDPNHEWSLPAHFIYSGGAEVEPERIRAIAGTFIETDDGNFITRLFRPTQTDPGYNRLLFDWHPVLQSADAQTTGIMVYQSEPVEVFREGTVNVDALEYRQD